MNNAVQRCICHQPTIYIYCNHVHYHLAPFSYHPSTTATTNSIPTNMCPIFLLLLLPLLSLAIPLLPRQSNSTDPFILRAFRQGSPIHLSSINANNGHFWLGKPTSSSCPSDPTPNCPTGTGTETAFVVSDNGHASLVRNKNPIT